MILKYLYIYIYHDIDCLDIYTYIFHDIEIYTYIMILFFAHIYKYIFSIS